MPYRQTFWVIFLRLFSFSHSLVPNKHMNLIIYFKYISTVSKQKKGDKNFTLLNSEVKIWVMINKEIGISRCFASGKVCAMWWQYPLLNICCALLLSWIHLSIWLEKKKLYAFSKNTLCILKKYFEEPKYMAFVMSRYDCLPR